MLKLEIPEDCCAVARKMISHGLDPNEVIEFCRGEMVCLRGTARAFASRTVQENDRIGPIHVRYRPMPPEAMAARKRARSPWERISEVPPSGT
jgi:hypothetical protein